MYRSLILTLACLLAAPDLAAAQMAMNGEGASAGAIADRARPQDALPEPDRLRDQDWRDQDWREQAPLPMLVWVQSRAEPGSIIVSLSDRLLYKITAPGNALAYPVAVPRPDTLWQGSLPVTDKREWPIWRPTASILAELPDLPREVPGGAPDNPLGARALYLGNTTYRIHGTDAPWTIGEAVSHGCIRMFNAHIIELYETTRLGTDVIVTQDAMLSDTRPDWAQ